MDRDRWLLGVAVAAVFAILLMLAPAAAQQQDCPASQRPQMSQQRPPAFIVDNLAVLRRAPRSRDRLPRALRRRGPLAVIFARYTRYLGRHAGRRFYLVPGRAVTPCSKNRPRGYTCLADKRDRQQGVGWLCTPGRSAITSPGYGGGAAKAGEDSVRYTIAGLARDGVARVQAFFKDGSSRAATVRRNLFVFTVVRPASDEPGSHFPTTIRYLDRDGEIIFERP